MEKAVKQRDIKSPFEDFNTNVDLNAPHAKESQKFGGLLGCCC